MGVDGAPVMGNAPLSEQKLCGQETAYVQILILFQPYLCTADFQEKSQTIPRPCNTFLKSAACGTFRVRPGPLGVELLHFFRIRDRAGVVRHGTVTTSGGSLLHRRSSVQKSQKPFRCIGWAFALWEPLRDDVIEDLFLRNCSHCDLFRNARSAGSESLRFGPTAFARSRACSVFSLSIVA